MIASPSEESDGDVFHQNPFKRKMLESLYVYTSNFVTTSVILCHIYRIIHYAKNNDIQTAVMLCCVFDKYSFEICENGFTNHVVPSNKPSSNRSVIYFSIIIDLFLLYNF